MGARGGIIDTAKTSGRYSNKPSCYQVRHYADHSVFQQSQALLAASLRGPDNDSQAWALEEQPGGT